MSIRIRYAKTAQEHLLLSTKKFSHPTNGAVYKVFINTQELSYTIIEAGSNLKVAEGRASVMHRVKKAAKEAIEKLGIVFVEEKRDRVSVTPATQEQPKAS